MAEVGGRAPTGVKNVVAQLAALYDQGRYEEAIALGEPMLGFGRSEPGFGTIRFHLAMSFLQLGWPQRAKQLIADAREFFEAAGDAVMVVDCMNAEACVALLEQREDAIERAAAALAACCNLKPAPQPLEERVLCTVATTHLVAGEWEEAISFYEEALEREGSVLDLRRHAKILSGLGLAHHELGQLDRSVLYATRAVALLETLRDPISLMRAENNLGYVLVARGELASARTHLSRAFELWNEIGRPFGTYTVLTSLCGLCLAEGDIAQATAFVDQALALAERDDEHWFAVEARMWKARIAERLGDLQQADLQFELAVCRARRLHPGRRQVQVHVAYGEVLEKRGDLRRACDQLKAALSITRSGRGDPVLVGAD